MGRRSKMNKNFSQETHPGMISENVNPAINEDTPAIVQNPAPPEQKQEARIELPSKLPCLRCKRDTEGEIFCGDCGLKRNINS